MDIDKLITTANNSYQTNKYRSYRECYNDGVLVLADLIRQQLLQQTPCKTHVCHICGSEDGHTPECTYYLPMVSREM
jgi:hypothetical protein